MVRRGSDRRATRLFPFRPRPAVAAGEAPHHGGSHRPGQRPVNGYVDAQPEHLRPVRRPRRSHVVLRGDLLLGGDHQVVLGGRAQPAREGHGYDLRPASRACAARAIGSFSAPMGGEYTFSIVARSWIVIPVLTAMARKSARSLIPSRPTICAPMSRSGPGSASSFTRSFSTPG